MSGSKRNRGNVLSEEGRALLEWFNTIAKSGPRTLNIDDLTNGQHMWEVLQRIRPEVFDGNLPERTSQSTGSWVANWQNLKHIYKALSNYITSHEDRLPKGLEDLDLQSLAQDEGTAEAVKVLVSFYDADINTDCTVKLLKMILFAAVNADDNAPFINPMASLSQNHQLLVQKAIIEFQDITDSDGPTETTQGSASGDRDLYWEEQLAKMARESEKIARENHDLKTNLREQSDRVARLNQNNNSLQEKLSTLQEKVENSSGSRVGGSVLKEIEVKIKDQEDHIAYQEAQIIDLQKTNSVLERDAGRYHELQDKFQPLQDSFDEMKAERDTLSRKANTMDKYKAKLQTLADLEKENESLRSAMDELREVNKDGNQAKDLAKAYQRQIDEMSRTIPAIEQELFESKMMKQQLDDNARQLRKQLEDANSRYEQDQSTIRDLMDQLQLDTSHLQGKDSLENELDLEETPKSAEKSLVAEHILEVSRLSMLNSHVDHEAITKKLKEALTDSDVRYKALESMLAAAKHRNKKLEGIIEEGYASKEDADQFQGSPFAVPAQTVLTDLERRNKHRKDLDNADLGADRKVFTPDEGDDGLLLHEFLARYAYEDKVALVDKHELQRMRGFEAEAFKAEELQARNKDLQAQILEYQKLIRRQDEKSGANQVIGKDNEEQLAKQQAEIKELKKQLDASKPALLKASEQLQLKQQLEIYKRENKLVSSAFYDLSSRLQLNNVSLQRRSDAPKSFLNKQRLLVSQATAVRMPR